MKNIITATIATALFSLTCGTSALADESAQSGLLEYTTVGSAAYQHSYGSTHERTQTRTHAITPGDLWLSQNPEKSMRELSALDAHYRQAWKAATGTTLAPQQFVNVGTTLISWYYYTPANRVVPLAVAYGCQGESAPKTFCANAPAYFAKHRAH